MSRTAPATAHPAVVRLRTAPVVNSPVATSPEVEGCWITPRSANAEPRAIGIAHAYASWYTHGIDPRKRTVEPAVAAISSRPYAAASNRPSGAPGRSRPRTRQISRLNSRAVTIQARSIDTVVSRPSKRSVTASSGMRSSAGPGGK